MNKLKSLFSCFCLLMVTSSAFANPTYTVYCNYSDGTSWHGSSNNLGTAMGMVHHCKTSGGTFTSFITPIH